MIEKLTAEQKFRKPIVTQVVPAQTFWKAEEYHQKYLEKRGGELPHLTAASVIVIPLPA